MGAGDREIRRRRDIRFVHLHLPAGGRRFAIVVGHAERYGEQAAWRGVRVGCVLGARMHTIVAEIPSVDVNGAVRVGAGVDEIALERRQSALGRKCRDRCNIRWTIADTAAVVTASRQKPGHEDQGKARAKRIVPTWVRGCYCHNKLGLTSLKVREWAQEALRLIVSSPPRRRVAAVDARLRRFFSDAP